MNPALDVRNLGKRFPGVRPYPWAPRAPDTVALEHATFEVRPGEIFSLIGPNGAGKTTLLKILSTLLIPSEGTATILGFDLLRDEAEVRSRVALVTNSERSFYYRLSGWENLRFFCGLYNLGRSELERRLQPTAKNLGLTDEILARDYRTYSTGTQRKLQFLRAFVLETPVLFLDEPTSSLDPVSAEEIRRVIATECRDRHQTVVMSANNLIDVERLSDRVAFIHQGHLETLDEVPSTGGRVPLRLFLRAPPDEVARVLEAWAETTPGVGPFDVAARAGGVFVRLYVDDPKATLEPLLTALWEHGLVVDQIDLRPFVLEEEFLRRVDTGAEAEEEPLN